MTRHSFALLPFPGPHIPEIGITGSISRERSLLTVRYDLTGELDSVFFPEPVSTPARREGLWLSTCFEFFLAVPGRPQYWEFNLSPSGEWNAFRMDAYRRVGFRPEPRVQEVRLDFQRGPDRARLDAAVDLGAMLDPNLNLQTGITSVIRTREGHETFWALVHPNPEADFHLRESFTLALAGTDPL